MKFKHIFLVWLVADIFLAIATFIYCFFDSPNNISAAIGTPVMLCAYGFLITLPSLLLLLIFTPYLIRKNTQSKKAYIFAIVGINFLYLIATALFFGLSDGGIYLLFYAGTTIAGLIALYIVKKFTKLES